MGAQGPERTLTCKTYPSDNIRTQSSLKQEEHSSASLSNFVTKGKKQINTHKAHIRHHVVTWAAPWPAVSQMSILSEGASWTDEGINEDCREMGESLPHGDGAKQAAGGTMSQLVEGQRKGRRERKWTVHLGTTSLMWTEDQSWEARGWVLSPHFAFLYFELASLTSVLLIKWWGKVLVIER